MTCFLLDFTAAPELIATELATETEVAQVMRQAALYEHRAARKVERKRH